jgi:regulator of replication initiation timing
MTKEELQDRIDELEDEINTLEDENHWIEIEIMELKRLEKELIESQGELKRLKQSLEKYRPQDFREEQLFEIFFETIQIST